MFKQLCTWVEQIFTTTKCLLSLSWPCRRSSSEANKSGDTSKLPTKTKSLDRYNNVQDYIRQQKVIASKAASKAGWLWLLPKLMKMIERSFACSLHTTYLVLVSGCAGDAKVVHLYLYKSRTFKTVQQNSKCCFRKHVHEHTLAFIVCNVWSSPRNNCLKIKTVIFLDCANPRDPSMKPWLGSCFVYCFETSDNWRKAS